MQLPSPPPSAALDFHEEGSLARHVAQGDQQAMEMLYQFIFRATRRVLNGRLRDQDPDDFFHETLTIVMEAILNGELRNPAALPGYVQSVIRRQGAMCIVRNVSRRRRMVDFGSVAECARSAVDIEADMLLREQSDLVKRGLRRLGSRDRELMTRFYLKGEPFLQICRDMNLTETQFRLYKSRAKAKLTAWARSMASVRPV